MRRFAENDPNKDKRPSDQRGKMPSHRQLPSPMRSRRPLLAWIVFVLLAFMAYSLYSQGQPTEIRITYSQLVSEIDAGNVSTISIAANQVRGELAVPRSVTISGREVEYYKFKSYLPFEDPALITAIQENNPGAIIEGEPPSTNWGGIMFSILPLAVIVAFWLFIMRSMRGGGAGKAFSFGKSGARLLAEDRPKVTFNDVAGLPEAKQELQELVEFLRDPRKFQRLGGKIPKGALLLGAPGTGKTLLAKAVAGEANVPFLSISGSDFVEMFVGVGAARVRDLFEQGKKHAPCIIFIDEIDAVGRMRGAGLGGGHDEREQTLNQLLVEMDGFESNDGVILLAATNRPDVLDPALLRPGRFDRQIIVDWPDFKGRVGILHVSARNVTVGEDVNFETLARSTPGLSGADIANLVNEAALLAARKNHDAVTMDDFEDAKDKIMLGMERKSVILSEEELKITSYHESGHALVAWLIPEADPIHKVTITPRGHGSLGITHFLPVDERHLYSRTRILNDLAITLGGRAAEELVFGEITSGAATDIDYATNTARRMVCVWGMSDELGPVTLGKEERQVFIGREIAHVKEHSDATAVLIDREIRRIVDESIDHARRLLTENIDKLHLLAGGLLERETLSGEDVNGILGVRPGGEPREKPGREDDAAAVAEQKDADNKAEAQPADEAAEAPAASASGESEPEEKPPDAE